MPGQIQGQIPLGPQEPDPDPFSPAGPAPGSLSLFYRLDPAKPFDPPTVPAQARRALGGVVEDPYRSVEDQPGQDQGK
ncbi:MAG: hypothetical protein MI702_10420 [Chlorobiales bacterium]|nr:hypothetical protein [Chlorobiales bacterium]